MNPIPIYCRNNDQQILCTPGTTLGGLAQQLHLNPTAPFLAAFVNHRLKDLAFEVYKPYHVQFIDLSHTDGTRTYIRSLSFLLQKAVHDLYPKKKMILDYTVSNGLYGVLDTVNPAPCTPQEIEAITQRMRQLVEAKMSFIHTILPIKEAIDIFRSIGKEQKALLLETRQSFYASVYYLDGYPDCYFGPLTPDTGVLQVFGLIPFHQGFLLQYPGPDDHDNIRPRIRQEKMFEVFKEHSNWCNVIGAKSIGSINSLIQSDKAPEMIMVSEALHERKYAQIADELYKRRDQLKLVLIAGPSSSGKTTTSKRLGLHAQVVGLKPVVIELDNYFVDREKTPKDANGDYDFEALEALDLAFLNEQLLALFRGEEVELPTFNFVQGRRFFHGNTIRLGENEVLILEGIHALNPKLTEVVAAAHKYKVYASALTALSLDENNRIFTTDNRLLRRMVRDAQFRGASAENTILRWPSVRRGEDKNIFPFQEQADIMFNSALLYELPVLRYFAEPLLRRISPTSLAWPEAWRLLKFLHYIEYMQPKNFVHIPPVSVIREFIGNSGLF
ncbi:MAG: nucleoside kinase [Prevotellaceae bacterium]|nr:nucleoside kinase [Prevotellaceae bacterium]